MLINLCHNKENKIIMIGTASHEIISFNFVLTIQSWYLKPNLEHFNEDESKYYPSKKKKQCCRDCRYCLHKWMLGTNLKIFWKRWDKMFIHCTEQNQFQRKYVTIYSNHYKDEYNINELREQNDIWSTQAKTKSLE